MIKIENFGLINPNEFEEHPLREKVFLEETLQCLDAYKESKAKVGKIFPVIYTVDGSKKLVIDGLKHVRQAIEDKVELVLALKVDVVAEDIPQLIVELHRNYHLSIEEEHKMCAHLYDKFKLQKGFRSDKVKDEQEGQNNETELTNSETGKKKRRPVVYDKIAKIMCIKPNRVKQLLKVGKVNPWYFERIEKERTSLYAAYCKCNEEEEGVEQKAPRVRDTVYVSSSTETPVFGSESKTFEAPFIYTQPDSKPQDEGTGSMTAEAGKKAQLVYTVQKQICPHCGEIFEFITPKSNNEV